VKPDIVHTHNLNGFSVAAWGEVKKRKIPLVHTMHDYYLMCRRATLYRNGQICRNRCKDCSLMTTLSGRWSKELNAVISVSEFVLNEHRRYGYFPGVPGHVVYNVAHHDNPRNSESNVSASAQTLGFIGRLCEEKGIEVLLKAFQKIRSPEVRLRIAGTGSQDYVERLQREYQDARITWLGFTRSEDFYPSVGTVIIPSVWHDPLPYVAVETILAGKNLICSDSGGLPELARLTKKSALFRCADVSNLSEVIERVIADSSTARADVDGSASAEMNFDESAILAKHTQIYASL
jgi:glycosyltransferase involved in cell wall biosynthesis